jgi:hypothetical protein
MAVVGSTLASVLTPRVALALLLLSVVGAAALIAWSLLGDGLGVPLLAPTRWAPARLG